MSSSSSDSEELHLFLQSQQQPRRRDHKAKCKQVDYSYSSLVTSDKKVQINFTDLSKLSNKLDTSKDVPLKKPQSAYVLFGNEQRAVICQKEKGLKVTEVVKMIAKEWQKLNKQQRQKYRDAAKRDKERYSQELIKLSRVNDQTLLYQMPKKPLTAYMYFVRQTRVRVAKEKPDIPPLDIMKEVGKEWQRVSTKDLAKFKQLAKQDDQRYQQEMCRFIEHLNHLRHQGEEQQPESARSRGKDDGSTANITPMKPPEHSQLLLRPKKPLSAYIFYSQEQRDLLKKEHPHLSTRDVMLQVSKQWAALRKNERQYYVRLASEDKRRFEGEMAGLRQGITPKLQIQTMDLPYMTSEPCQVEECEIQELSPLMMRHRNLFEFDF